MTHSTSSHPTSVESIAVVAFHLLLGWVHTCNVTAYRNTVSWQCGRDSWPRNLSNVGYAVALRVCSVCCRYLAVASKGWYGYGLSRCGRATWRWTSTPALALAVSSLLCEFATQRDLVLLLSVSSILLFPYGHPVAASVFFHFFPSFLPSIFP